MSFYQLFEDIMSRTVGLLIVCYSAFYALNVLVCGIIWRCTTIKINTQFNVVCTQIVPHCGTNWGCGINQGNTHVASVKNRMSCAYKEINLLNTLCTISKESYH